MGSPSEQNPILRILAPKTPPKKPTPHPQGPGDKFVQQSQQNYLAGVKAQSAKADADLKDRLNRTVNVQVHTAYGTASVPKQGYEAMNLDEKTSWLKQTRKDIEDNERDLRAPNVQGPVSKGFSPPQSGSAKDATNPYDPGAPKDEFGETIKNLKVFSDAVTSMSPGMQTKDAARQSPLLNGIMTGTSNALEGLGNKLKVDLPEANDKTTSGSGLADSITHGVVSGIANIPSDIFSGYGEAVDPTLEGTDSLSGALKGGMSVIAAADAAKAGVNGLKGVAESLKPKASETPGLLNGIIDHPTPIGPSPKVDFQPVQPRAQFTPSDSGPYAGNGGVKTPVTSFVEDANPDIKYPGWREITGHVKSDLQSQFPRRGRNKGADKLIDELGNSLTSGQPHPEISKLFGEDKPFGTEPKPQVQPNAKLQENPVTQPTQSNHANPGAGPQEPPAQVRATPQETQANVNANGQLQDGNVVGLSNQLQSARGESGGVVAPESGTIRSKSDIHQSGLDAVNGGLSPDDHLAMMEKTGKVAGADDFSIIHQGQVQKQSSINALENHLLNTTDPATRKVLIDQKSAAEADLSQFEQRAQKYKTQWAETGHSLQIGTDIDTGNYAQVLQKAKSNSVSGDITPKDKIKIANQAKQINDLGERISKLEAENAKILQDRRIRSAGSGGRKVKISDLDTEFTSLLSDLSKQTSALHSGINPDAVATVGKMVANRVKRGALTVAEAVEPVLLAIKAHFPEATERDVRDAYSGYINQEQAVNLPPTARQSDIQTQAAMKAVARNQSKFEDVQSGLTVVKKEPLPAFTKQVENLRKERDILRAKQLDVIEAQKPKSGLDKFLEAQRTVLLSNPLSTVKLAANSASVVGLHPLEQALGGLYGKIPGLRKAGTAGMFDAKATYKGAKAALSSKADMVAKIKTGYTPMEAEARNLGIERFSSASKNPVLKVEENVHGAIKTPAKNQAFVTEYEKQLKQARLTGKPITHEEAFERAYAMGKQAILMNDSKAVQGFRNLTKSLPLLKTVTPITTVPINFAGRVGEYTLGLPYGFIRGVQGAITGDALVQGAAIRALSRGTIGIGMATIGIVLAKKGRVALDKFDNLYFDGHQVPSQFMHVPAIEAIKQGVAFYNTHGSFEDKVGEYGLTGVKGMANNPMIQTPKMAVDAMQSPGSFEKKSGQIIAGMSIPQIVAQVAKSMDHKPGRPFEPQSRKTKGFWDAFKVLIPGVRQTLPKANTGPKR